MNTKKDYFKGLQLFCFAIIVLNFEWALWTVLPRSSTLFSIACMGVFTLNLIMAFIKLYKIKWCNYLPTYITFIIWSVIMIVVSHFFYHVYRNVTFLFFTLDAHAIFYIRMFVSILPCMFLVDVCDFKETKLFKYIFGLIILSNTFFTLRAVQVFPDALRARGTMENLGEEQYLLGTPDYAMVYGMALVFPALLQKCKNAKTGNEKIFYIICTAMVAYIITASQFATALLIMLIGALIFAFVNMKFSKKIIFISIILLVFILNWGLHLDEIFLNWLSGVVNGTWAEKLQDIALSISSGDISGSLLGRQDLYQKSIKAFFESPIFGKMLKNTSNIGGHATALDILGLAGIVGFIPFGLTIVFNYFRLKATCNYNKNKAAIIACVIEFAFLAFSKNIITSLSIFFSFFVMIPFLLKLGEEEQNYI